MEKATREKIFAESVAKIAAIAMKSATAEADRAKLKASNAHKQKLIVTVLAINAVTGKNANANSASSDS